MFHHLLHQYNNKLKVYELMNAWNLNKNNRLSKNLLIEVKLPSKQFKQF